MRNNILLDNLSKKPNFLEKIELSFKKRKKMKGKFKPLSKGMLKLDNKHIKNFFETNIIPLFKDNEIKKLKKELGNNPYTLFTPSPLLTSLNTSVFPNVLLFSLIMRLDYLNGKKLDYSSKDAQYIYSNAHKNEEISSKVICINSLIFLAGSDGIFHLPIINYTKNEKASLESLKSLLKIFKFKVFRNNVVHIDFSYNKNLYKLRIDLNKALSNKPSKPITQIKKSF